MKNLCDFCKHEKIINDKEICIIIKNKNAEIHKLRDKVNKLERRIDLIHSNFYLIRSNIYEKI